MHQGSIFALGCACGGAALLIIQCALRYVSEERRIKEVAIRKALLPTLLYTWRALDLHAVNIFDPFMGVKGKSGTEVEMQFRLNSGRHQRIRIVTCEGKMLLKIDGENPQEFPWSPQGAGRLAKIVNAILAEEWRREQIADPPPRQETSLRAPSPISQAQ